MTAHAATFSTDLLPTLAILKDAITAEATAGRRQIDVATELDAATVPQVLERLWQPLQRHEARLRRGQLGEALRVCSSVTCLYNQAHHRSSSCSLRTCSCCPRPCEGSRRSSQRGWTRRAGNVVSYIHIGASTAHTGATRKSTTGFLWASCRGCLRPGGACTAWRRAPRRWRGWAPCCEGGPVSRGWQ